MTSSARIQVSDLHFSYPTSDPILHDLSLTVEAGQRVAILGPNGSGKTTFALHLNGLLPLQRGTITIDDVPVTAQNLPEIRRAVGMVFQDPDDQLFMQTVADDVAFGPANLGMAPNQIADTVHDALASVRAEHLGPRTPHHLSGGEKRTVSIATVLAMNPAALVLDEPTAGLDPVGRRELSELLRSLPQTQLIVTHDLPFALATCDRSVIISNGTIVGDGPTREILQDTALLEQHRLELPWGFAIVDQP